jgi:hypothetical protein
MWSDVLVDTDAAQFLRPFLVDCQKFRLNLPNGAGVNIIRVEALYQLHPKRFTNNKELSRCGFVARFIIGWR